MLHHKLNIKIFVEYAICYFYFNISEKVEIQEKKVEQELLSLLSLGSEHILTEFVEPTDFIT